MPMNARLLRPVASGLHPEAKIWEASVVANGGSSSPSTLKAVSDFCKSIDSSGLRDKFFRLNLFCGDNLSAALVPLYLSSSKGGTTLGNSTDTNTGPFVSGDYSLASGLQGDGTTKYLVCATNHTQTLFPSGYDRRTGHTSASFAGATTNSKRISGTSGPSGNSFGFASNANTATTQSWCGSIISRAAPATLTHWMIRSNASYAMALYENGSSVATGTQTSAAGTLNQPFSIFAAGSGGTPFPGRILMYSIGQSMDDSQASAFYSAVSAFFTAIGRS